MVKKLLKTGAVCAALLTLSAAVHAQTRQITKEEYIATYAPLAIEHQKIYGIPASIKMAQGILESAYGNSELTRMSNNHFGIKCKSYWEGLKFYYDDDEMGECFRGYESAEKSFCDHSEFLKNSPRYSKLFELPVTDYKSWAYGLKDAGYATAKHYASSLIKCIEENELYLLDEGEYPAYLASIEPVSFLDVAHVEISTDPEPVELEEHVVFVHKAGSHSVYSRGGNRYVVAAAGETYADIAKELGIPTRRLLKYNGKPKGAALTAGETVFIENPDK